MELSEIRTKIDAVDDQLLQLFLERMSLAAIAAGAAAGTGVSSRTASQNSPPSTRQSAAADSSAVRRVWSIDVPSCVFSVRSALGCAGERQNMYRLCWKRRPPFRLEPSRFFDRSVLTGRPLRSASTFHSSPGAGRPPHPRPSRREWTTRWRWRRRGSDRPARRRWPLGRTGSP